MANKTKLQSGSPKADYHINDVTKEVHPTPRTIDDTYVSRGLFQGKHLVIIGGDSGIGRSVAILFSKEGAHVTLTYTANELEDAKQTADIINRYTYADIYQIDIGNEDEVKTFVDTLDSIDYFIYNPAEQHTTKRVRDITSEQVHRVYKTNVFGAFYFLIHGIDKINENGSIIFTTSITAFKPTPHLLDYSSTKGALTALMQSLSMMDELVQRKVNVNAVAPGPVWTPLIPATTPTDEQLDEEAVNQSYSHPIDIAPTYVYLCDPYQKHVNGQTIHVNIDHTKPDE